MESIRRTKIADLLKQPAIDTTVNVKGWVRSKRGNKNVNFIALNDGSSNAFHFCLIILLSFRSQI